MNERVVQKWLNRIRQLFKMRVQEPRVEYGQMCIILLQDSILHIFLKNGAGGV